MADFTALKTAIQTYIKQNGNEEITGNILQEVLLSVVTTLGDSAINDLITALGNEVTARQQADGTLQQNITNEATARGNADTALSNRLGSTITAENTAAEQIAALQGLINGVKNNVDNGYVYAGIATPSSTPVTGKVFYLALTAGTYTNFGSTEVSQGINILKYNGSAWSFDAFIGIDDTPTPNSPKLVKSGGTFDSIMTDGSAFDISAHFASGGTLATYADLSAALTALNGLDAAYKRGGMSVKYVQSSDNNYVQYRLMTQWFSTTPSDWQGIDEEPILNSKNLIGSNGVFSSLSVEGFTENFNINNIIKEIYIEGDNIPQDIYVYQIYIDNEGHHVIGFKSQAGGGGELIYLHYSSQETTLIDETYNGLRFCLLVDWSLVGSSGNYTNSNNKFKSKITNLDFSPTIKQYIYSLNANKNSLVSDSDIINKFFKEVYFYGDGLVNYPNNLYVYQIHKNFPNEGQFGIYFRSGPSASYSLVVNIWNTNNYPYVEGYNTDTNVGVKAVVDWSVVPDGATEYSIEIKEYSKSIPYWPYIGNKEGKVKRLNYICCGDSQMDGWTNDNYSYINYLNDWDVLSILVKNTVTGSLIRTFADDLSNNDIINADGILISGGSNYPDEFSVGTINDEPTPDWLIPNKSYSVGDKVLAGPRYQKGFSKDGQGMNVQVSDYIYECTIAGTSLTNGSEFSTTIGSSNVSGTATFECVGVATVYGDLKRVCKKIWDINPSQYIFFIIPIMNGDLNNGEQRQKTFDATVNFCEKYRIDYVNLQDKFTINTMNMFGYGSGSRYLFNDGLHPNDYGQKLIAKILKKYIS